MNENELLHSTLWYPLKALGLTNPFWAVNAETLINTWYVISIITLLALIGRRVMYNQNSIAGHVARTYIKTFKTMVSQSLEADAPERYIAWIAGLFTFILLCNTIILLPGCEEPTTDLNTTFALSILSFLYIQKETIRSHGLLSYISHYIKFPLSFLPSTYSFISILSLPFRALVNIIAALLGLPLELLSKMASIISMAFRLFGNILGGSLITTMFKKAVASATIFQLIALFGGFSLVISLFFGAFEGFIQAFVFSVISLTYLALGVRHE